MNDVTVEAAEQILSMMLAQGKRQWGNAVKSFRPIFPASLVNSFPKLFA